MGWNLLHNKTNTQGETIGRVGQYRLLSPVPSWYDHSLDVTGSRTCTVKVFIGPGSMLPDLTESQNLMAQTVITLYLL